MPLYDYRCGRCRHVFELKQSFDAEPIATCPQCQGEAQRLFRAVPVIFKGSGWYVNDHGKGRSSTNGNRDQQGSEPAAAAEAPKSPPTATPKPESAPSSVTSPKD